MTFLWILFCSACVALAFPVRTPPQKTLSPSWSDTDLQALVALRGQGVEWSAISQTLQRSKAACVQRYQAIVKLQTWSNERLDVLFESTCRFGENWAQVSAVTGFTQDSCRTRYMQFIRSFHTGPWLPAEDEQLMQALPGAPLTRQAFAVSSPPNWRRVSHLLQRSTFDCRTRFHRLAFDVDLGDSQDVWYEGEMRRVEELRSLPRRPGWSEVGRELGRSAMQCYNLATARQRPQLQEVPRAVAGDEVDSSEVATPDADAASGNDVVIDDDEDDDDAQRPPVAAPYVDFSSALQEVQQSVQLFSSLGPFFRLPYLGKKPAPTVSPPPPPPVTVTVAGGAAPAADVETVGPDPAGGEPKPGVLLPAHDERPTEVLAATDVTAADSAVPVIFGRRKSRKWSAAEDTSLLALFATLGTQWTVIGGSLGRTGAQCFQRHQILLQRAQRQVPLRGWDEAQKAELARLVAERGPKWTEIGAALGRTSYVCRAAYKRLATVGAAVALGDDAPSPMQPGSGTAGPVAAAAAVAVVDTDGEKGGKLWAKDDDDVLKGLVATLGRRWSSIAETMGRSPEDVMLRYDFKIAPRRLGSWTREEDRRLLELVEQLSSASPASAWATTPDGDPDRPSSWARIGAAIGRTGAQCRVRYHLSLDPRLKWRLWTVIEDDQLLSLRNERGYNWAMISAVLDRSANSCRYRYALTHSLTYHAAPCCVVSADRTPPCVCAWTLLIFLSVCRYIKITKRST